MMTIESLIQDFQDELNIKDDNNYKEEIENDNKENM